MKENGLQFVILFNIMGNPFPSTSHINTKCPVVVDTSDIYERIMRPMHLKIWEQIRNAMDLLQKFCY